jgi:hypothetical protein
MDIRIQSLLTGAEQAMGSVAIIDVLRAFTTAAVAERLKSQWWAQSKRL